MENNEQKEVKKSKKKHHGRITKQVENICGAIVAVCGAIVAVAGMLSSGLFDKQTIESSFDILNQAHLYYESGDKEKSLEYYELLKNDTDYRGIVCNNIAYLYFSTPEFLAEDELKTTKIYKYLKRAALSGNKTAVINLDKFLCYNDIYRFESDEDDVDVVVAVLVENGRIKGKEDLKLQFVHTGYIIAHDEALVSNEDIKYTLLSSSNYLDINDPARYTTENRYDKYEKRRSEEYGTKELTLRYDHTLFDEL